MKRLALLTILLVIMLGCKKPIAYQIICRVCKVTLERGHLPGGMETHPEFSYNSTTKIACKDTICDSCLDAKISIRVGKITRCPGCGKVLHNATKLVRAKRADSLSIFPKPIRFVAGVACSRACEIKGLHPDWSDSICKVVADGKIIFGMNRDQVLESWGAPDDIKRVVFPKKVVEGWYYKEYILHFEDDSLVSWED